jgi:glycosyltransferase involved in cell wall biosynthesis
MKYSIILPVRNGGEYVKDCVSSILAQRLSAFNLHILDNYSTDGTLQWIESLNDSRIIIYPTKKPLSIEENWEG